MYSISTLVKKVYMVGVLFAGVVIVGEAQSVSRSFAGSLVVLRSGDTLRGPLTYMPEREMVIVTMPDLIHKTFTPTALRAFVVKGEITGYSLASTTISKPDARTSGMAELYSNPTSPVLARYL